MTDALRQAVDEIVVATPGQGLHAITAELARWTGRQGIGAGLLTLYIRHTSASLVIQENADPDVVRDLNDFFRRVVPEDARLYRHASEGPDDMPAHIRAALTQSHLAIPVDGGRLGLGTWQGVYVFEHRARPHRRRIALHLLGQ